MSDDLNYFRVRPWRSWRLGGSLYLLLLLLPACQQEMAGQPSYKPLRPSDFFPDGRSARPIPAGTIARGLEPADSPLRTGRRNPEKPPAGPEDYVDAFPFRLTAEDLRRGQERFTIYCAVCHGPTGDANSKIVERGYLKPPNYHTDYSRGIDRRWNRKVPLPQVPVGYYFEVVSRGYGAMPDYAAQVKPRDRWLIIAYIRTLQLSQHIRLQDLPEEDRRKAREALNEENKR